VIITRSEARPAAQRRANNSCCKTFVALSSVTKTPFNRAIPIWKARIRLWHAPSTTSLYRPVNDNKRTDFSWRVRLNSSYRHNASSVRYIVLKTVRAIASAQFLTTGDVGTGGVRVTDVAAGRKHVRRKYERLSSAYVPSPILFLWNKRDRVFSGLRCNRLCYIHGYYPRIVAMNYYLRVFREKPTGV